ncbi:MAG: hypothetical protein V3S64_12465, partial [bacterium]
MKGLSIGAKIGGSFFLLAFLLIATIGITIWQVTETTAISQRAIELRAPTARTSVLLLNGVNHSLAALRGWIILGADKFKQERAGAWVEIDRSLAAMDGFSKNWTNPKNVAALAQMKGLFEQFKGYQQEIEDIAQTTENRPASKMLLIEAAPQASILVDRITKIINIEAKLEATPKRKALLGMMADVRGTTARSLANIRAFLLSGQPVFEERFNTMWTKNIKRFGDLQQNANLLNPAQRKLFAEFSKARAVFSPLPSKMFEIRKGNEWNMANRWLGTKAAPTAFKIKEILDGMAENQRQLLETDSAAAKEKSSTLLTVNWVLLAVGLVVALFLGFVVTRNIARLMAAL